MRKSLEFIVDTTELKLVESDGTPDGSRMGYWDVP
jgi:hypothetical protein